VGVFSGAGHGRWVDPCGRVPPAMGAGRLPAAACGGVGGAALERSQQQRRGRAQRRSLRGRARATPAPPIDAGLGGGGVRAPAQAVAGGAMMMRHASTAHHTVRATVHDTVAWCDDQCCPCQPIPCHRCRRTAVAASLPRPLRRCSFPSAPPPRPPAAGLILRCCTCGCPVGGSPMLPASHAGRCSGKVGDRGPRARHWASGPHVYPAAPTRLYSPAVFPPPPSLTCRSFTRLPTFSTPSMRARRPPQPRLRAAADLYTSCTRWWW